MSFLNFWPRWLLEAFALELFNILSWKLNWNYKESVLEKTRKKQWCLCICSHVRDSLPVPPHVLGQRFWSLHPLEASPRQIGYPSKPGSVLWVYHFQCASASVHKNTPQRQQTKVSFWVSVKRRYFKYYEQFPYLQIVIQSELSEVILEMNSEVHVLYRVHHNIDELHARHLSHEGSDDDIWHQ